MKSYLNLLTLLPLRLWPHRLQEKAADTIESLHKAGMKVWVLTGDKMETAAATCYASKLFHRNTQILELTTKRTEEQSLHDVLFDLSRTVLRQHGGMTRDTISGYVFGYVLLDVASGWQVDLNAFIFWGNQPIGRLH